MRCPKCYNGADKVLNVRSKEDDSIIRRRRQCLHCNNRWTTYEIDAEFLKNTEMNILIAKLVGDDNMT